MQRSVAPDAEYNRAEVSQLLPVSARNLQVSRGGRTILDGVDFSLTPAAQTTVILGPNGAGKSLLIRILAGLVAADSGQLTWAGTPPDRARMPRIGFVFQRPVHLQRSALANIVYALAITGTAKSDQQGQARTALEKAGLADLAEQPARVLSGGEQQRLALARAFACNPELLILDEPTSSLDPASTAAIEAMVIAIRQAGTAVLMVTHDIGQARRLADEVVFMHRGRILERTPAGPFFKQPRTPEAAAFVKGEIVL